MRDSAITNDVRELLLATLVVGILVVGRQFAAIAENRRHVERERRALISTISHELRTPLTAMVGFLDILRAPTAEMLSTEETNEMLGVVDDQARYISRIVGDLILLARGRSDQMQLSRAEVRVRDLIDGAIASVDYNIDDLQVVAPAGLHAELDANRIQQALANLISNAVRYGGDQRAVVVRTTGSDLLIDVHDSGAGVPKRHELSVWERFERGAHRFDATTPGSGIGLAIVDAIAAAHGGERSYRRSELLGGACFGIRIPDVVVSSRLTVSGGDPMAAPDPVNQTTPAARVQNAPSSD